jgi:pimeloyl-ACP methyl ester carboxylesterase
MRACECICAPVVIFVLLAFASGATGQKPVAGELRLSSCPAEISAPAHCGTFTVRENRNARTGRTIDLNVILLKATGPDPQPDPLVWLTGGPGQDATAMARGLADAPGRRTRDVLLVDQRGTGESNGLFCAPEPTAPAAAFIATMDTARAHR